MRIQTPPKQTNRAPDLDWEYIAQTDHEAGFEIASDYVPFDQMNDVFTRAFWDAGVKSNHTEGFFASYREAPVFKNADGMGRKDFALRNAAWSLSDMISERARDQGKREGFQGYIRISSRVSLSKFDIDDPEKEAREIKSLASFFGADLCGITKVDPRWHYSKIPNLAAIKAVENDLPEGMTHVIVMGHEMDAELVETYPSALAGAATGREYSHEAAIVTQLASYIRGLGYEAYASMNDTALVIPYAIKAGLGEYGRNQMVLTPEFGPRVRFSKIFTNMPLAVDRPRRLGLADYCSSCTECADACPPKALPKGDPTWGGDNPSMSKGVRKWNADCEKCFAYWAKLKTDCAICMRVCPFSKPRGWFDRIWYTFATRPVTRKFAQIWHERYRKTKRLRPRDWWSRQ